MANENLPNPRKPTSLEQGVRAAFKYRNPRAGKGLVTVIERSLQYVKVERDTREIIVDRRAVLFSILETGLDRVSDNAATWFAKWIQIGKGLEKSIYVVLSNAVQNNAPAIKTARTSSNWDVIASSTMREV